MRVHVVRPDDILVLRHVEDVDPRGIVQHQPTLMMIEHDATDDTERLVYLTWRSIRATGAAGDPREAMIRDALLADDIEGAV